MISGEWTEVIDGVRVVHTGRSKVEYRKSDYGIERKMVEEIELYDVKTGYRFYTNCDSVEKAKVVMQKLAAEGRHAIIGPKAPWFDGGTITRNESNDVGVYLAD